MPLVLRRYAVRCIFSEVVLITRDVYVSATDEAEAEHLARNGAFVDVSQPFGAKTMEQEFVAVSESSSPALLPDFPSHHEIQMRDEALERQPLPSPVELPPFDEGDTE